jgi:hypothetical protein
MLRRLTIKIKRENTFEKTVVSLPPVTTAISKPMFSPKRIRKTVAAVEIVKPMIVRLV